MPLLLLFLVLFSSPALAARAKDVGRFEGLQENTLIGAGLVVGLARTGDSPRNEATVRSLITRLQGLGVRVPDDAIMSRNIAMVTVSAVLPAEGRPGSSVDVTVASTGDASSLEGGVLLDTPLSAMDGQVYALASGSVVVGGFSVQSAGNSTKKAVPTVGHVMGGAEILRDVPSHDFNALETVDFILDRPDFTTAGRLATAINDAFAAEIAEPESSSTIRIAIPVEFQGRFVRFAQRVEEVRVSVDADARVVIDERTGTVVMGADVEIAAVAVAHGALTIEVRRLNQVSQPAPFSSGTTEIVSNSQVSVDQPGGQLVLVEGANIGELVAALNAMGVSPRDLVTILKAMRAAGAIHADITTL